MISRKKQDFKMIHVSRILAFLFLIATIGNSAEDIVINELNYHPIDDAPTEFIELYNPTAQPINLSGYTFTDGVAYTIPAGTIVQPNRYLLVVRFPTHSAWRNLPKIGPYIGKLSNTGETILLRAPDGRIVDGFTYSDSPPWPRGADGYGATLERISPDLSSEDYHSWRASLNEGGTPGQENSVVGTPVRPTVVSYRTEPVSPTSNNDVRVEFFLDGAEWINTVKLKVETIRDGSLQRNLSLSMTAQAISDSLSVFFVVIPKQPSQTLVRFCLEITLNNGTLFYLPHIAEPRPFESYFVYDNEIPTSLPLLWMFSGVSTRIHNQTMIISGAVFQSRGGEPAQVFDGVRIVSSRNGQKIRFIKGEEWQGNRTLNIIPESPPRGTTAGAQSPHVEQLSFRIMRDFGVLAPQSEWLRVIERGSHTQRIFVQQPNEQFLRINDRDPSGNIYKIAYNEPGGYSKKNNLDEGNEDYIELFRQVNTNNRTNLAESLRKYLVIEAVMGYEVAVNLMSHWDGIKNNMFLYHYPSPVDQWEIIPWDMDKTFGYTDSDPMFWKMPVDFPLTGNAPGSPELISRNLVGPIGRPFHMDAELHQEYVRRVQEALDGLFSIARIGGMIDEKEQLLLEDLQLLESYTRQARQTRRNQIITSYETMRFFLRNRHAYLRTQFPTSFTAARMTPRNTYQPGSTISGIRITVKTLGDEAVTATVTETIPSNFSATKIQADVGTTSFSANTITWRFSNFTGEAVLTYDLTAPASNPPFKATITGSISDGEISYPLADAELQYSLPVGGLSADWVVGAGMWAVVDGVLTCYSDSNTDPKHVWVGINFGAGDYTVKADVRMLDWQNQDLARSGVAVRVNPNDGQKALNFLFHDDAGSVDLLNDLVAWGTRGDYAWQVGEWYTMTLRAEGSFLEGTIKKTGTNQIPYTISWNDPALALRSPGFPGLTGSSLNGLTAQFDNFEVIVNGRVVFSDNFNSDTDIEKWEIY
jgi:hypothetical protein